MPVRLTNFTAPGEPDELVIEGPRFVAARDPDSPTLDLNGAELLPPRVDAHCHVLPSGLDLLRPDFGDCRTHEEALEKLREAAQDEATGEWLLGRGYDQNHFEGQHLSRHQLDQIVPDRPVLLRHVSGHASVVNSACLKAAGIGPEEPDPQGGTFVRDESGELTGVLLETAHERVYNRTPEPSHEALVQAILRAAESMSGYGIAAAADMMTGYMNLERELLAYREAAEKGARVRIRLYLQWSPLFGPKAVAPERLQDLLDGLDESRLAVRGVKLFADGALSSGTAALREPYVYGGTGQLIYSPTELTRRVQVASAEGWSVAVHAIGDSAADLTLDAFESTEEPSRHRIEHAMMLDDQLIERLAKARCWTVTQPEFLARFGPAYPRHVGPDRTRRIKPHASLLAQGCRLAFSSDRPIVSGDPQVGIHAASHRPEVFDPEENISSRQAEWLYTEAAARALGDHDIGALSPGHEASFTAVLSDGRRVQVRQGNLDPLKGTICN